MGEEGSYVLRQNLPPWSWPKPASTLSPVQKTSQFSPAGLAPRATRGCSGVVRAPGVAGIPGCARPIFCLLGEYHMLLARWFVSPFCARRSVILCFHVTSSAGAKPWLWLKVSHSERRALQWGNFPSDLVTGREQQGKTEKSRLTLYF